MTNSCFIQLIKICFDCTCSARASKILRVRPNSLQTPKNADNLKYNTCAHTLLKTYSGVTISSRLLFLNW